MLFGAEDEKALDQIYDEATASGGKDAGERAVQATITAGCVATTTQYGGAVWCGPVVAKAWPVIRGGMEWITKGMGDAFMAIVPNAWEAKGAHCWMCALIAANQAQLDQLWQNTVSGLEQFSRELRENAGLAPQPIDVNAELRKRLWADPIGPGLPSRTRSNPDTLTTIVTEEECYQTPSGQGFRTTCQPVSRVVTRPDHKPWDVISGTGFSWTNGEVRLNPQGGPADARASGLPKDPSTGQVAATNHWYLGAMQNLRYRPFAFVSAEIMRDIARGVEIEKAEAEESETSPLVTLTLLGALGAGGYAAWKYGWLTKLWRIVK